MTPLFELNGRTFHTNGEVVYTADAVIDFLLAGNTDINSLIAANTPDIERYNNACWTFDISDQQIRCPSGKEPSCQFILPEKYLTMDVRQYLIDRCPEEGMERLMEEWQEFESRDLIGVLQAMIYITDTCVEHDIVTGVGRGSSVACYILYLIGVHLVNPLEYDLDFASFFHD